MAESALLAVMEDNRLAKKVEEVDQAMQQELGADGEEIVARIGQEAAQAPASPPPSGAAPSGGKRKR